MSAFVRLCFLLGLLSIQAVAGPRTTTAKFDSEIGLYVLKYQSVEVSKAQFVFWSDDWRWRGLALASKFGPRFHYQINASNEEMGLTIGASASRVAAIEMEWHLHLRPGADISGGLSIKFDQAAMEGANSGSNLKVLAGGEGWSMQLSDDLGPIYFLVSPAPSQIVFQEGGKGEVRVYLAKPGEKLIAADYSINLRLPPGDIIELAPQERLGRPDESCTEWNMDKHPSYERQVLPAYLASIGSLQDWNVIMEYAYSQSPLGGPGRMTQWESAVDPAILAMMPVGALVYRKQHIRRGISLTYLQPQPADFIDAALSPISSRAISTLTETKRWRIAFPYLAALDWFGPAPPLQNDAIVTDMAANFSRNGERVCADNGDFCRNWEKGIFTIATAWTQMASGWIGGEAIALSATRISLSTPYAALAIQSLNKQPFAPSRSILMSMGAQSYSAPSAGSLTRTEPIVGEIAFRAPPGLLAYA